MVAYIKLQKNVGGKNGIKKIAKIWLNHEKEVRKMPKNAQEDAFWEIKVAKKKRPQMREEIRNIFPPSPAVTHT